MDEQPTPKSDELRDLIQSLIAGMTSGYQEFKAMEQRLAEATTLLEEALDDWADASYFHDVSIEYKIRAFLAQ